jgi:hypothetical protein
LALKPYCHNAYIFNAPGISFPAALAFPLVFALRGELPHLSIPRRFLAMNSILVNNR